jgi:glycosyltransferase involved in cell wall biosynthesis
MQPISWRQLGLSAPDFLFQGGYAYAAFNELSKECRREGGKVVLMADNNWQGTLRQRTLEPIRHRIKICQRFDGMLVPGVSGMRFARVMGYPPVLTVTGLYGADPTLFADYCPLERRQRVFLFVGQFIARKNVLGLCRAFARFATEHPDWTLRLCGNGPQRPDIPDHPAIKIEGFVQASDLALILREARCLVLPSLEEHWGLVVHEAALSGCALALSNVVAAGDDLAQPENAVLFPPGRDKPIERALRTIARWDDQRWAEAQRVSRDRAQQFGPERFADAVDTLMVRLTSAERHKRSLYASAWLNRK